MKIVHRHIATSSNEEQRQMLLGIHQRCVELLRDSENRHILPKVLSCDIRGR